MSFKENQTVLNKIITYPEPIQAKLLSLRQLIIDTAEEEGITSLEEDLKWGQASYVSLKGTTLRIDQYDKNHCAIFFHCQSSLGSIYRSLYKKELNIVKKRAILIEIDKEIPMDILKHCISIALNYHTIKNSLL